MPDHEGERTVYLLSSGHYSEYAVHAAFTDQEEAQRQLNAYNELTTWEEYRIEEKPLDPPLPAKLSYWTVFMKKDGTVISTDQNHLGPGSPRPFKVWFPPHADDPSMIYASFADTKKKAIKAANETRTALIANNRWGKNDA